MIPVILSGGSGSRLWPRSRREYPKQFLPLAASNSTMIQQTALRLSGLETSSAPIVVCNEQHRFMVAEQLQQIGAKPAAILLESFGRNTAPAVTLAALHAIKQQEDALLLVLPADHVIANIGNFHDVVRKGAEAARQGLLVTFGIVPSHPETGYGYIRRAEPVTGLADTFSVARFVEKPDRENAEAFIADGGYYWNSGMFIFTATRYLEEIKRLSPDIYEHCQRALEGAEQDRDFTWLDRNAFQDCPEDSIDYAVMEKTTATAVVPLDANWNDLGSWQSLWEIEQKDSNGNAGQGQLLVIDSRNCLLMGEKRLIAAVGVEDLVIIDSDDAVLVAPRARAQDIKLVVSALEAQGSTRHLYHRKVFRPWGHYDCLDSGDRFQVKRITVKPGGQLSLQLHHHRAEHWIVVRGTAKVTCGDKTLLLAENESTFIPLGTPHRLENPGKVELEIIEVQSGSYLGEDDIVRLEDSYGRVPS
jgi:mannose-1-phosphate guanylyltransferase/mannose-6-phosphate isomerase